MKKIIKTGLKITLYTIGCLIILTILFYVGYISLLNADGITGDDGVATGYFTKVDAQGNLEKKYTQM